MSVAGIICEYDPLHTGHAYLRTLQRVRRPPQRRDIAALRAEHQLRYHAGTGQNVHTALREPLRRRHGPHRGRLQYQIGAAAHGHLRPGQLVRHGEAAPLGEVPAEGADHRLRPAVGKSAFSLSLAEVAAKHGTVLLYSLEMSADEVAERLQVRHTNSVTLSDLVNGQTQSEAIWQELADAASELSAPPIRICDAPNMTVSRIRAQAMAQENLSCVIVDYVGLLRPDHRNDNRNLELGQISRDLKNLAAELRVPVIALAQLNRGRDETEQPTLRDLRDSGELEQNANKVLLLWKADVERSIIGCSVAKNRRGKTGTVQFRFEGVHMRFWPMFRGKYVEPCSARSTAYDRIMGGAL